MVVNGALLSRYLHEDFSDAGVGQLQTPMLAAFGAERKVHTWRRQVASAYARSITAINQLNGTFCNKAFTLTWPD